MSDIIKIKLGNKKVKAVLSTEMDGTKGVVEVDDEETSQKKLQMEYERGFNDGYKQGAEEVENKYEQLIIEKNEEFYEILKKFEEKIEEYENAFTETVIKLASVISKKILKREIENESIIEQTISEALGQVIAADNIIVKINPDDLHLIESESGSERNLKFSKIRFETDPAIEKGGCFVETEIGNVDARINAQLDEIIKHLELSFVKNKEDDAD